jgi:hypothetical protein
MSKGVRLMGYRKNEKAILSIFRSLQKKDKKIRFSRRVALTIIVMMLLTNVQVFLVFSPVSHVSALSIDSRVEPAIVLGSDVPDFAGTPVGDIWVYAYIGASWEQIPFQVDERNDTTDSYYVDAVDGILDSNDEIVFMPFDAGTTAPLTSWIKNTDPKRYEVTVTDPLDASSKYVYIYTSSSLVRTFTKDYVDYNPASAVITATDYSVGFDDAKIGIMDEIRINTSIGGDNVDVLDRLKYRIQATIMGFPILLDEDDFTYDLTGYTDGPVRVIQQIGSGDLIDINYAYKSYAIATQKFTFTTSPDWVRVSMDFLSTSTPMTYYDSISNMLTIDGNPDSPITTPPPTWVEITGSHGTVVSPRDFTQVGGNPVLYYNDDQSSNDAPESESGEYGDSGLYIADPPTGSPSTYISFYMLPPNQGNVGSTYVTYNDNPITISALPQIVDTTPPPIISDVTVIPDPQEVNDYVNISAIIEDNYKVFGAWVNVIDPNDDPLGNFSMSYDPVTGRYYLDRTYGILGTYKFTIWANDTGNNWDFSQGQFLMHDTAIPTITDLTTIPDPQEVNGYVNISAVIDDNYQVNGAWVNIKDPNDDPVGNFSLSYDSGNGRYYINRTYDIIGTYQFTIWVTDANDNWNFLSGQFLMQDTTLPTINDVTSLPDPQEVNDHVNISAVIADNNEISGVWVEIIDPDNATVGNFSMNYDSTAGRYYYDSNYDILGTYQFIILTKDASNNWNFAQGQFEMQDTTPPTISDTISLPDPQEINGFVDISAEIEDNHELNEVWVNITDPNGELVGNFSMIYDSGSGKYHDNRAYDVIGTYQFTIWTNDTSGNWNLSSGEFEINDIGLPTITDVTALPDPQEVNGFVDISADIEDNYDLSEVWVNITDPNGDSVGNFSMIYDSGSGKYHDNRAYDMVGTYQFTIWANDATGNWNSSSGEFEVHDTGLPTITDVTELPDPQEVDDYVNISAVVTDIVGVDSVRVDITDPNNDPLGNFSMIYDSDENRYYYHRLYDIVGTYHFVIWASDRSDNWESESGQFSIRDSTSPVAHAGSDISAFEGTSVIFDGSASTDNVGIVQYTWTFTDGTSQTLSGVGPTYLFDTFGEFEVTLTVEDAAGNEDTATMWVNVSIVPDTTPPTITHTPETEGTEDKELVITTEITDDVEVTDVILFYRTSGETDYMQIEMTNTDGDTWTTEIPSYAVTTSGVEYYIFATDGVNDATDPETDAQENPHQVEIKGEEKEEDESDSSWLLLLILIIVVVIVLLILFFFIKNKKKNQE